MARAPSGEKDLHKMMSIQPTEMLQGGYRDGWLGRIELESSSPKWRIPQFWLNWAERMKKGVAAAPMIKTSIFLGEVILVIQNIM